MLSLASSQSMYPASGIQFRNPFQTQTEHQYRPQFDFGTTVSTFGSGDLYSERQSTYPLARPPTPPLDMNSVASQYSHYAERSTIQPSYECVPVKNEAGMYGQDQQYRNVQSNQEIISQPSSRPRSPVFLQNVATGTNGAQRKDSQLNPIAPSLQIPRSINNSQGSLSELAAQITCLFWFESAATLERAEDPATCHYPIQPLVPDAIPTTGFRKWVTTILSTTQVAQNVIILALLFIYRLKKLNPTVKGKPGSEYRLLTVALMLGNKFLDDNTYTNKTWAEVSGISVMEVHIMEVEFLSNMKYALFTSAEEWTQWQTQLGQFVGFFEQASRMPNLPNIGSPMTLPQMAHIPQILPSPPVSNQASPPIHGNQMPVHPSYQQPARMPHHGITPVPSPLGPTPDLYAESARKRSIDTYTAEPPAKRLATSNAVYNQQQSGQSSSNVSAHTQSRHLPRVTLPSIATSQNHAAYSNQALPAPSQITTQLPPLNYAHRAVIMNPTSNQPWPQALSISASAQQYPLTQSQIPSLAQSIPHSRQHSPYPGSAGVSPTNGPLQPAGQVNPIVLSPSVFLAQRNSPYRPIRGVSTLLVPPPSSTMHQPQNVDRDQMHYQPLGRPQERQQGRLPYIHQNQWYDGNYLQPQQPHPQQQHNQQYGR